ncbi:hypothetical protein ACVW0Y_004606 [Pseudomonas sp. TE3786]
MNEATAVTTRQLFDYLDSAPLFSVNPGVPVEDALERAADLMLYVETLAASDAFTNKVLESAVIQTLSEMANALVNATKKGEDKAKA